jgi:hypothetical protein
LTACDALAAVDAAFPRDMEEDRPERVQWHKDWQAGFNRVAATEASTIAGILARLTVAADTEGTAAGIDLLRSAIDNLRGNTAERVQVPYFLADEMGAQQVTALEIQRLSRIAMQFVDQASQILKAVHMAAGEPFLQDIQTILQSVERAAASIEDAAQRFDASVG